MGPKAYAPLRHTDRAERERLLRISTLGFTLLEPRSTFTPKPARLPPLLHLHRSQRDTMADTHGKSGLKETRPGQASAQPSGRERESGEGRLAAQPWGGPSARPSARPRPLVSAETRMRRPHSRPQAAGPRTAEGRPQQRAGKRQRRDRGSTLTTATAASGEERGRAPPALRYLYSGRGGARARMRT